MDGSGLARQAGSGAEGLARHGRQGTARQVEARHGRHGKHQKTQETIMASKSIKWRDGSRYKCTASAAHHFLERIKSENGGEINFSDAVHKSKPKDAPLHNDLEWSDKKCGELYRVGQVKKLTRSIQVVVKGVETRAYESTRVEVCSAEKPEPEIRNVWRSVEDVLADPAARNELLGQAVRDALAFRRRYAALSELATLIDTIDAEVSKLA